jgi:predicted amidohydrolase YtcJ
VTRADQADVLFAAEVPTAGAVWTGTASSTDAVAVRDGRIIAIGREARDRRGPSTDVIDEVLARLADFAAATPEAPWVVGYGDPPEILPGGVGRSATLDAVVADRPVALWSSDHHMVWCNSRALQVAGIMAASADPPRGTVVRDADGSLR